MSATKTRMPLAEAERLASEVVELLRPACERIEVAGSIRRRRPEVGDIEIVCVPRVAEQRATLDMFGEPLACMPVPDPLTILCDRQRNEGSFTLRLDKNGRPAWGAKLKRAAYRGVGLDLFSVIGPPAQWGVLFLIRTGSADFSHRLVTPRRQGGWMPEWLKCRDGALWRGAELMPTPEETDVFALLGREWIPPELREV